MNPVDEWVSVFLHRWMRNNNDLISFSHIQIIQPFIHLFLVLKTSSLVLPAEPVSEVVIKSNMPEAIENNSTVILTCSAKGSFLKFTWTNGTAPIVADGKRITLKEVGSDAGRTIDLPFVC